MSQRQKTEDRRQKTNTRISARVSQCKTLASAASGQRSSNSTSGRVLKSQQQQVKKNVSFNHLEGLMVFLNVESEHKEETDRAEGPFH